MKIHLSRSYSFSQLGKRSNQEDSRYPDCDELNDGATAFFLVCDGVGGNEKGEVASRTVCDSFGASLASFDWTKEFTERDFEAALDTAFNALAEKSCESNRGMATTLTFVAFHAGGCFIAHIGDSRVYYVRPGEGIVYRTEDHSLVNALVRAGVITEKEAETHPDRNVITRAVCVPADDEERAAATTANISDVRQGDYLFLCSDGVLENVSGSRLLEILSGEESDKEKCRQIAALSSGSNDNNTAWLVRIGEVEGVSAATAVGTHETVMTHETVVSPRKASPKRVGTKALVLGAVVAIAAILAGYFIFKDAFSEERETMKEQSSGVVPDEAPEQATTVGVDKLFPGGKQAVNAFVKKNLKYPSDALRQKKEGTVIVGMRLTEKGKIEDVGIIEGVFPSLDKEALRLCSLLPGLSLVTERGKPVEAKVIFPIEFKLPTVREKEEPAVEKPKPTGREQEQVKPKQPKNSESREEPGEKQEIPAMFI